MAHKDNLDAEATRQALATAAPAAAITQRPADEFGQFVNKYSEAILAGLPESYGQNRDAKIQRFLRVLSTEVRRNPDLMLPARRVSLLAAMCLSAQLGLEPGPSQRVYFIPYGNEIQFQLGWRGIAELAYRSGQVKLITTQVVREGDLFEVGIKDWQPYMVFKPKFTGENRPLEKVVAFVRYANGETDYEVMERKDIDEIMRRSQSAKATKDASDNWVATKGPWSTDYEEMARKTALKRLAKRVPMSEEDKRAIEQDEGVFQTIEPHMVDVPDTRAHADVFAGDVPQAVQVQTDGADPDTGEFIEGAVEVEAEEEAEPEATEDDTKCPRRSKENCDVTKCFPDECRDPRGPVA
jgi:recombination protein RecT